MKTSAQPVLILVIVAGITFIVGYMMGWTRPQGAGALAVSETAPAPVEVAQVPTDVEPAPPREAGEEAVLAPEDPVPAKPEVIAAAAPQKPESSAMSSDAAAIAESAPAKPRAPGQPNRAVNPSDGSQAAATPRQALAATAGPAPRTAPKPAETNPLSKRGQSAPPNPAAGAPHIAFEDVEYDFGTVMIGEPVEHEFVFRNLGTGTLQIDKVRTSCGCTAALVTEKEVAPGGEGRVKATFRTTNYKGAQHKSVYVETNDPEQPQVTLRLSGEVKVEVEVSPATIYARDLVPGESRPFKMVVKRADGRDLRITKISASRPEIHLGEPQQQADGSHEIEVTLGPELPEGRLNGQITIETDSERQPRVTVRVYGSLQAQS